MLVVEDEPVINQAVADRLTAEGFEVAQEYAGPAAVATAASWHPDAVVLDVMLPGFDGHEVCRRVQATRPVPVLMLTAAAEPGTNSRAWADGVDYYLAKPFTADAVLDLIDGVLSQQVRVNDR